VALNERSLHLTVSVVYPTVADFVAWGLEQDRFGVPFMDIRPTNADRKDVAESCRNYFMALFDGKNLDIFLRSFYASRASSRIRASFPLLNTASLEVGFRRTPFDIVTLESGEENGYVATFALGRIHSLTPAEHKLLRELPHVGAMSGQDIASLGGGWDTVAPILDSLMDRGLVGKVASTSSSVARSVRREYEYSGTKG
jgi:hypothetical protein